MGLFDKLFGKQKGNQEENLKNNESEHAVIIHFNYGIEGLEALHGLEDKLEKVITENNVGDYDGHEIAVDYSDGFLYMYGPNAENLFKAVKPILVITDFMKGAKAKLRFGPPYDGVKEIEVEL
ncbi:hypothetical protein AHMF7605_00510 [Adhaeribacter arboris]|uniref:Uncharacterized protein n=1 Tax=Adhaeribacter arboris TaxID=2072846 RepID=A0A2T2Y9C1_9BACT|nr:hypothetical protein [Adhaeribacter arboris]PSR52107.1 hypothetical protein AHMF7605_00510 [Adhaeribacter arboris]